MAWTYSAGVLTSTGATEASPDSLLAGISIVQAADALLGYRSGFVAWLANVEIRVAGSFIAIDKDATIELLGSSFINPGNGGVIHDSRSTLILSMTTGRVDADNDFETGSSLICRRDNPYDPNPAIIYKQTSRVDYPTILFGQAPAKVDIAGLDLYDDTDANVTLAGALKLYFGSATSASAKNIRFFSAGKVQGQWFSSTYDDFYLQTFSLASEYIASTIVFNRPSYYFSSPVPFDGPIRSAKVTINNPTFLNDCWNGGTEVDDAASQSLMKIAYSFRSIFKQGLSPLEGINVRFTRLRESLTGTSTWTAPDAVFTETTNANGTYTEVYLTDAYRAGATLTSIERFNWSMKARSYDKRTPGDTVFSERVLYQGSVDLSKGYLEEVQMLSVSGLTLTQAQAEALTGIAFSASGTTGGTVTITEAHTSEDIWAAYRVWISTLDNFDSEDTWLLSGVELNVGAWDVVIEGAVYTGDMTTTGVITLADGAEFIGTRTDANGTIAPPKVVSITGITAGSRLQIYNVTTDAEIVNTTLAGTSYSATYSEGTDYSDGDIVRVRLTYADSTEAKLPYEAQAVVGAFGWSVLASQQNDTVYAAIGIDGFTVTEFVADFPNVQIDISDPDGTTRVDRLYSWFVFTQYYDEDGIRQWFGGIVPEDEANFRIVTDTLDLKIDNTAATGVTFVDGRRLYRDDNASPLVQSTSGGGSITLFAGKVYTSVVSTSDAVITGDISQVPAAVQSGMTAQGYTSARAVKIDTIDATATQVSSDTAAIKERTDNLPDDPASETQVNTRLASASYTSPDNAGIAAIKERTDNLPDDPASSGQVEEAAFL